MKIPTGKIALSYAGFYGKTFEEFLDLVSQKNLRAAQLIPDQVPNLYSSFDETRAQKLLQFSRANDIRIHVHNVFYDINLLSLVPEVRTNSFKITKRILEFCQRLEAETLTVHPGYMFPGWRNDAIQNSRFWDNARDAMTELSWLASETQTCVLLENGSYFLTTATGTKRTPLHVGISIDEMEKLLSGTNERICLSLDVGKALASGINPGEFFLRFGHRIRQLQFSNQDAIDWIENVVSADLLNDEKFFFVFEGGPEKLEQILAH